MKILIYLFFCLLSNLALAVSFEYRSLPVHHAGAQLIDVYTTSELEGIELNGVFYEIGYEDFEATDGLVFFGKVNDKHLIRFWSGHELVLITSDNEEHPVSELGSASVKTFGFKNNFWHGMATSGQGNLSNWKINGERFDGLLVGPLFVVKTPPQVTVTDFRSVSTDFSLNTLPTFSYKSIIETTKVTPLSLKSHTPLKLLLSLGTQSDQVIDMEMFLDNSYREVYSYYNNGSKTPLAILLRGLLNILSPYSTTTMYLNPSREKLQEFNSSDILRALKVGTWHAGSYLVGENVWNVLSEIEIQNLRVFENIVPELIMVNTRIRDGVYYVSFFNTQSELPYLWIDLAFPDDKLPDDYLVEYSTEQGILSESVSNLPILLQLTQ